MSAREMFETLGYECRKNENAIQYLSNVVKKLRLFLDHIDLSNNAISFH